ncbi:MAG: hypothetical protein N3B01_05585, partial [Verrucomicrobiae bacterium]|nr:hypothetical protein [Verrucomicrobiae bacterium]
MEPNIMPTLVFLVRSFASAALAQHGVIREFAALAPKPDAVPLPPLFDASSTDISVTLGPDEAFYLTGSAWDGRGGIFTNR